MPGGEVWSVNPTFFLLDEPASVSGAEALAIANAVNGITVPTGLRAFMNSQTLFTGTRVEARDRAGVLEAQAEQPRVTTVPGTGVAAHPYQTSTVTSLRSSFPGGRGRGRLYWPATGATLLATNLRIDPTVVGVGLTAVRTYLKAIQDAVAVSAGPNDLAVWSRAGSAFHKIIEVRQGDVADTQRRRRDALTENYSTLTYPT
jgi:hypothetical protein